MGTTKEFILLGRSQNLQWFLSPMNCLMWDPPPSNAQRAQIFLDRSLISAAATLVANSLYGTAVLRIGAD